MEQSLVFYIPEQDDNTYGDAIAAVVVVVVVVAVDAIIIVAVVHPDRVCSMLGIGHHWH